MLLTAFPPAPPTPTTVIRGLNLGLRLRETEVIVIRHFSTQTRGVSARSDGPGRFWRDPSRHRLFCFLSTACRDCRSLHNILPKSFPNPTANRPIRPDVLPSPPVVPGRRHGGAWRRRAGPRRLRRAGHGGIRQPRQSQRPADADFLIEDGRRDFGTPSSWQAPPTMTRDAGQLIHTAGLRAIADQLECLSIRGG